MFDLNTADLGMQDIIWQLLVSNIGSANAVLVLVAIDVGVSTAKPKLFCPAVDKDGSEEFELKWFFTFNDGNTRNRETSKSEEESYNELSEDDEGWASDSFGNEGHDGRNTPRDDHGKREE